jgi:multiple sugar transport system permease protein
LKYRIKEQLHTYTLILPWIAVFSIFWLYPLLYAAFLSFSEYQTLSGEHTFIGLDNYIRILSDKIFLISLKNTLVFTLGTVPVTTALALFLAVLLDSKLVKFKNFFRSSFFMPSVTSMVVIALIFTNLYTQDGYINSLMKMLNLTYPERGWLMNQNTALFSIMAMDVWMATGYYMVLFLAGMQTIPKDLYESAILAGANSWQKFIKITLPLVKPTLLFVVVINTIKSFQVFIEIYVMTKGGPLNSTTTLVYHIYNNAFEKTDTMGYASAMAFILFFILMLFSFIQMKILRSK